MRPILIRKPAAIACGPARTRTPSSLMSCAACLNWGCPAAGRDWPRLSSGRPLLRHRCGRQGCACDALWPSGHIGRPAQRLGARPGPRRGRGYRPAGTEDSGHRADRDLTHGVGRSPSRMKSGRVPAQRLHRLTPGEARFACLDRAFEKLKPARADPQSSPGPARAARSGSRDATPAARFRFSSSMRRPDKAPACTCTLMRKHGWSGAAKPSSSSEMTRRTPRPETSSSRRPRCRIAG